MKAEPMRVYWAEANGGNLEWPKGMLVVALGEHDALQAALWKYGKHLTSCRRNVDMTSWCDCGWDRIRETLSPQSPQGELRASGGTSKLASIQPQGTAGESPAPLCLCAAFECHGPESD